MLCLVVHLRNKGYHNNINTWETWSSFECSHFKNSLHGFRSSIVTYYIVRSKPVFCLNLLVFLLHEKHETLALCLWQRVLDANGKLDESDRIWLARLRGIMGVSQFEGERALESVTAPVYRQASGDRWNRFDWLGRTRGSSDVSRWGLRDNNAEWRNSGMQQRPSPGEEDGAFRITHGIVSYHEICYTRWWSWWLLRNSFLLVCSQAICKFESWWTLCLNTCERNEPLCVWVVVLEWINKCEA